MFHGSNYGTSATASAPGAFGSYVIHITKGAFMVAGLRWVQHPALIGQSALNVLL